MQKDRETEIGIEIKRDRGKERYKNSREIVEQIGRRDRQTRKWIENDGLFEK
jgi:hypothetical protein